MDENRLKHSLVVARKMVEIAKRQALNEKCQKECFAIGFCHDIGYEFASDKSEHNKIGGKILKEAGFKYWKEIYYHGTPNSPHNSPYLDILNRADMLVDASGNAIGYEERLEDIKKRYGENSKIYKNAVSLIARLET